MRLLTMENKIENRKIEKITIHQPSHFADNFISYPPKSSVDTASSLKYLVGAYLFTRRVGVEWYEEYEKILGCEEFISIVDKIEIIKDRELQEIFERENIVKGKVVIYTVDEKYEKELNLEQVKGNPRNNPLSMEDIKEKFVDLAEPIIGTNKANYFLESIDKNDYTIAMPELMEILRPE